MKKYIGFIVIAVLMLSFSVASSVKGEDGNGDNSDRSKSDSMRDFKDERQEDRGERQEDRQAFRVRMQTERQDFMARLKTDRDAFMTEVKARKEEWRDSKADRKMQFCQAAREAFTRRFEFAISQLEMYQGKVGDIIDRLKADGEDVTDATASLSLSKQNLSDAKEKLREIKALVPEGGCENMTAEIFEKIKVGARDAKDLLKKSRENLHEAIKDIRNLKGEDRNDDND